MPGNGVCGPVGRETKYYCAERHPHESPVFLIFMVLRRIAARVIMYGRGEQRRDLRDIQTRFFENSTSDQCDEWRTATDRIGWCQSPPRAEHWKEWKMDIIEQTDRDETRFEELAKELRELVIRQNGDFRPEMAGEITLLVWVLLNQVARTEDPELPFSNLRALSDEAFGHMLLQVFGEMPNDRVAAKQALLRIAHILGSDHIETIRWAVAFMQKVESF